MLAALAALAWTALPFDSRDLGLAQDRPFDSRDLGLAQDRPFDSRDLGLAQGKPAQRQSSARAWDERTIDLPIVGQSMAYVPHAPTTRVVLFISGDGGWNLGVVDMARRIAPTAVVIGISFPKLSHAALQAGGCWYPAGDLETLSHAAQKRLGLTEYHAPALVGYSSGATLVYAALAPAPPTTFAGGVSLGFCSDLDVGRPVCHSTGWSPVFDPKKHLSWLPAVRSLARPWYLLHGKQDQVCLPDQTRRFVSGIANAHLVELDGTGHGFAKPIHWGKPFDDALAEIWKANEPAPSPKPETPAFAAVEERLNRLRLPLEYRWPRGNASAWVVFFSGDGGWASLDEAVAETLTSRGIAVVGISSLRYFWREKTATQVGSDLRDILQSVGRPAFVGGYSFGAEVVPVVLRAWPTAERSSVDGLTLVAPGPSASFEIDPLDWVRTPREDPNTRVAPAVQDLRLPTLCVTGTEETGSACGALPGAPVYRVVRLPGSHHFDGNYAAVGNTIVAFIESVIAGRPGAERIVEGPDADAGRARSGTEIKQ